MKKIYEEIEERLLSLQDEKQSAHLMRFFKTGKGQYGEGDRFLGIKVPVTRSVVREFAHSAEIEEVEKLTSSQWHEVRLAGFLLLIEIYNRLKKRREGREKEAVDYYLSILERGNNWDLVDLVAPKILGDFISRHPDCENILDSLVEMEGRLWHQRVGVVANWSVICTGSYESIQRIAEKMLNHPHDLIHKAVGWMLREMGKRGGDKELRDFLNRNAGDMPRTMLRYSIERFSPEERAYYMKRK